MKKILLILLLLTVIAGGWFYYKANQPETEEGLKVSGFNNGFVFDENYTFDEYIQATKEMISLGTWGNRIGNEFALEANSPFLLKPSPECNTNKISKGIVLVHGYTGSPYNVKSLGEYFQQNCFTVMAPLLPGHGTRPGDLRNVKYQDWERAVQYSINQMNKIVDEVYIGGLSTGSTLGVLAAANDTQDIIKGVVVSVPALKLPWKAVLLPYARFFLRWDFVRDGDNLVQYETSTINGEYQLYKLTQKIRKLVKQNKTIDIPVFGIFVLEDIVTDAKSSLGILSTLSTNPNSQMILYHQEDSELPNVSTEIKTINATSEEDRIFGLSHSAPIERPDGEYYGVNGEYKNCLHYAYDSPEYIKCQNNTEVWGGEPTEANREKQVVQNLMYNPFFDDLLKELNLFLQK